MAIEIPEEVAPSGEDERYEDEEYNPAVEPSSARAWLNLLRESERAFEKWNDAADNIEKLYANLDKLRALVRDRQFALFWANLEILKPSIYARPPTPVVVPKFKDRRPLYNLASQVLERCCITAFDYARANDLMLLVRDDVATLGRGVVWCRYDPPEGKRPRNTKRSSSYEGSAYGNYGSYGADYKPEYVCLDFKSRRDFLHSLSRNWREVTWVAAASYLTRAQAKERFSEYSGDEYRHAEYKVDKEAKELGAGDARARGKFWEIWHKGLKKCVWVAEGCEKVLDEADPILKLQGFFPCPCPAYATTQPGSLVPVPDVLQYKDQLDEVNLLTDRIHALSDALEVKGFYPAGSAELGEAVEAAVKTHSSGRVLVPISNWAAFGGTKDVIIWLPIDQIATCITALVTLRKAIIDDIYQIMGLSDIMRGATDPQETLGAQQLKTQYGSVRVRGKQTELVRMCRDVVEITAEIIACEFDPDTIIDMCQMEIPTDDMQAQKLQELQQQFMQTQQKMQAAIQAAQQNPQMMQMAQQNPQAAQGLIDQGRQQLMKMAQEIQDEMQKPTLERVTAFLKDYRTTAFILDIETDSTIQVDEMQEKQRRGEFMAMLSQLLPQLAQLIMAEPRTAPFCGQILKFAVAPFRVSRNLDTAIDELVDNLMASAGQGGQKQNPEQQKVAALVQIEEKKLQHDAQMKQEERNIKLMEIKSKHDIDMQKVNGELQVALAEIEGRKQESDARVNEIGVKAVVERQKGDQKAREFSQKMTLNTQMAQQKMADAQQRSADMGARRAQADRAQLFKEQQAFMRPPGGVPR